MCTLKQLLWAGQVLTECEGCYFQRVLVAFVPLQDAVFC